MNIQDPHHTTIFFASLCSNSNAHIPTHALFLSLECIRIYSILFPCLDLPIESESNPVTKHTITTYIHILPSVDRAQCYSPLLPSLPSSASIFYILDLSHNTFAFTERADLCEA